jgi:iron complex outermembrane receptor protein
VKLRTSDGKLSFEADTYLYLYRNFQTQALSNARVISIDAGRARAYGLEGELRWRPQSWVELFGTYAFNHARFTSGAYDGNRFRLNPDHSASLGATLRTATGAGMIEATPTLTYRSRIFFDDTNGDPALLAGAVLLPINYHPSQAGYVLANLQLAFGPADRRWQIEAFVQNAFDRKYLRDSGQGSLAFGLPTYIAAPPRTFGMAFSIKG